MSFFPAFIIALSSFIALSFEILWFCVYNLITLGTIKGFGSVLGIYLAGIAFGSLWSSRYAQKNQENHQYHRLIPFTAQIILLISLGGFLFLPFTAILVTLIPY